jgi:predicted nucleic acid-binding protein
MTALFAFDSNILVYAEGLNDPARELRAKQLRAQLGPGQIVLPMQAIGEFYNVLTRKYLKPADMARALCQEWLDSATSIAAADQTFRDAIELAATSSLQIWDALILATAAEAGCIALLSEDMQHGFVHRGVTVINPFAEPEHPLLADALRHPG